MIDYARGIDVNHYHRPKSAADWRAVFDSGISFVGVKATQGAHYNDPTFVESRAAATPATAVLLYHFADETLDVDAQIAQFVDAVGTLAPNEIPVLDLERGKPGLTLPFLEDGAPASVMFTRAEHWLESVCDELDRTPVLYTRGAWISAGNPKLELSETVGLWVPRYRALELGPGELPASWTDWTFWQWSDGTTPPHEVPGVGAVDSNVFNGTVEDLEQWVTKQ